MERYIPTGAGHAKSWQFLSTASFGQSVNASWQESNAPLVTGTAGLGTTLTSEKAGAVARGYDFYTPSGPSIKTYNSSLNSWDGIDDGVSLTTSIPVANKKGYMLFVRGDRSVQTSSTPANPVTLRTSGRLYSPGADAPPSSIVTAGKPEAVGNPYASSIDFTSLTGTSAGIDSKYYIWDPLLPGTSGFGYGGYQLLSSVNGWLPSPGGTINYPTGVPYKKIQSGQAFFVYATSGGTVNFAESNKINGSQLVYRQNDMPGRQFLRSCLYSQSGYLADGNVVAFDDAFTNAFDKDDAIQLQNPGERLGIFSNDRVLALEARHTVNISDTIFYALNNLVINSYQLRFAPENMDTRLNAYLVDRFTDTRTMISLRDSTFINFAVSSDIASGAPNRFFLVFKASQPVPVHITSLTAMRNSDKTVSVQWSVENAGDIEGFELEHSEDGRNFRKINTIMPQPVGGAIATYSNVDKAADLTSNFYRIKAISRGGEIQYSNIARVAALEIAGGIDIYPNPVTGKQINIRFIAQNQGTYHLQLVNELGQVVQEDPEYVTGSDFFKTLSLTNAITPGNYHLNITMPGANVIIRKKLIVQ